MINDARVGVQWANWFPTLESGGLNIKYVCEKWETMIVFEEHFKNIFFLWKSFHVSVEGFEGFTEENMINVVL